MGHGFEADTTGAICGQLAGALYGWWGAQMGRNWRRSDGLKSEKRIEHWDGIATVGDLTKKNTGIKTKIGNDLHKMAVESQRMLAKDE